MKAWERCETSGTTGTPLNSPFGLPLVGIEVQGQQELAQLTSQCMVRYRGSDSWPNHAKRRSYSAGPGFVSGAPVRSPSGLINKAHARVPPLRSVVCVRQAEHVKYALHKGGGGATTCVQLNYIHAHPTRTKAHTMNGRQ